VTHPRHGKLEWPLVVIFAAGVIAIVWICIAAAATPAAAPTLSISNGMANLLEVNPMITLKTPAPSFTLTDQHGKRTSLRDFAGKAVVLTFGDDKCTDLCTLLAQDVVAADHDLGKSASDVQFVSINANPFYPTTDDTSQWTNQHGLRATSNWHFLTGSPATLARLAKAYGVDIELDHKTKSIVHGTDLFFIDPAGEEVQIGQFGVESANTSLYAHAMAQLAVDTLPVGGSVHVTGPSTSSKQSTSTALGEIAPPVELPQLTTRVPISTATYRGKFVVLNFWASSCPICTHELPALEKASAATGKKAVTLGVDVSDAAAPAHELVSKSGVTYPMLSDASGTTAAQFQIPGLPYTVILDPKAKVVVRHPGSITTEQLEYLLQTLETQGG
jgi:cytochrome oxidase Cu insertion factor (SCO1/SenC/PrrC family)